MEDPRIISTQFNSPKMPYYNVLVNIKLTLYCLLEVRRFHIITPPFRYDVKSVYPSFRTISVQQGVICCMNLKKSEKIFSGTKKARTKHIVCTSY